MQKALDTLNSGIQEVLTNVRVVKSFVREDYEEKRFAGTNRELKEAGLRALKIVIATMPVMMFAMNVTTLANCLVRRKPDYRRTDGGRRSDGIYDLHCTDSDVTYDALNGNFLQSSRAMASIRRIDEVLDEPIDLSDGKCITEGPEG